MSTTDQLCARQEHDLAAFAERTGYQVVSTYKETASDVKLDRAERKRVLALAQRREIDAVLVTELLRRGRSTTDLLAGIAEFERELAQEHIRSGIVAAKARGKRLSRQPR